MKLIQKQPLKGNREFEILDDVVNFRIKSLFHEEKLTVDLSILNPDPVVNKPFLEFHSRVKCGPLLALLIDKPNADKFNAFVDELKLRSRQAYSAFAGLETNRTGGKTKTINTAHVEEAIQMLEQHLDTDEIKPLLQALQALIDDSENESCFDQLIKAFDDLGSRQGAVLTYAPYVSILLSNDQTTY